MYDDSFGKSSIRRTLLDGSNNIIIEDGKMSMLHKVMGLTLDYANKHLYILEPDVIHRMDYDGTRRYLIFTRLRGRVGIIKLQNEIMSAVSPEK